MNNSEILAAIRREPWYRAPGKWSVLETAKVLSPEECRARELSDLLVGMVSYPGTVFIITGGAMIRMPGGIPLIALGFALYYYGLYRLWRS